MSRNEQDAFVRSIDTLREKDINLTIPRNSGWRGSKPLFESKDDSKKYLKKMCRKGIPATLRQAIWLTNATLASNPTKPKHISYKYALQSEQEVIDSAWKVAKKTTFPHFSGENENDAVVDEDVEIPDFGLGPSFLQTFLSSCGEHSDGHEKLLPAATRGGTQCLKQILVAIQTILGVEYCTLLPDLISILLTHMSIEYTYTTIRNIVQSSSSSSEETTNMHFVAISKVEHYALCRTFADLVLKMHPQLGRRMEVCGALSVKGLDPIFKRFFIPLLKFEDVLRAMDIFTIEGSKFMIRFGIGLLEQCKDIKHENVKDSDTWWTKVRSITHSRNFNFDQVIQKAYGFRGIPMFPLRQLNKRIPKRSSIHQLIKSNEKQAKLDIEKDDGGRASVPAFPPIDYIDGVDVPSKLVKPTSIRSHLAEWLPLGLKSSKLELIFSTDEHGCTLERFYTHCDSSKHTILLLEVLQTGATIGMYASQPWHINSRIYGDGTCFLFRAKPDPVCFKWKGGRGSGVGQAKKQHPEEPTTKADGGELTMTELALVEHFMDGKASHIAMGINRDGGSGLWLNEDLTKGSSSYTVGFENEPLAGKDLPYFDVGLVEVYRLVREIDGKPY